MEEERVNQSLNFEISAKRILMFTLPTMLSMVLMNGFGTLDGIFIARFLDVMSLAAMNVTLPIMTSTMAVGMMIAAGGAALIAKQKGRGQIVEARQNFTLLIIVSVLIGVLGSIGVLLFLEPLLEFLGANAYLMDLAKTYITPIVIAIPSITLGYVFQSFLVADGKPTLSMIVSALGGIGSATMNFIFLNIMDLNIFYAALGTVIGLSLPTIVGLCYFTFARNEGLYFVKPKMNLGVIGKSITNGTSEFISMFSIAITSTFMNNIVIDIAGPSGVAAVGIMIALQGLITSLFIGYAFGVSPIVSYNYGKKKEERLQKTYKLSLNIIAGLSIVAVSVGIIFASQLTRIYVGAGTEVYNLAVRGLRMVSWSFVLIAFNTFTSAFFVALNNGTVSGILSFCRSLVFLIGSLLILPQMFDMNGIWLAMPFAEMLAIVLTIYFLKKMNQKYHYAH
jgi:Na+-driven multidrug efflux pump